MRCLVFDRATVKITCACFVSLIRIAEYMCVVSLCQTVSSQLLCWLYLVGFLASASSFLWSELLRGIRPIRDSMYQSTSTWYNIIP